MKRRLVLVHIIGTIETTLPDEVIARRVQAWLENGTFKEALGDALGATDGPPCDYAPEVSGATVHSVGRKP